MQNPKDISDHTTALDMALELMSKAFKLNNIATTNNNQRSSSNLYDIQIAQSCMNIDQDRQMLMVDDNVGNQFRENVVHNVGHFVGQNAVQNPSIQIVENMNGLSVVSEIENQYGNENVVPAPAEGNGNGINENNLQQASTSGTQSDKTPVYDSDASAETTYKNLFDSISMTRAQSKTIIESLQDKLHDTIYENAKLRAQLFDKFYEQKDTTRGTNANTNFEKQSILGKPPSSFRPKLYVVTPLSKSTAFPKVGEMNALSNQVTSNSVPSSQESNVVKNNNVLSPGIFRINPFKDSKVDNFVPNKHVKASVKSKPITISQPHVITKKDVNSITNGFSSKNVKSTTRTRRPQPRNNPKNYKIPSKSKSSCVSNKLEKIEENHRSLQSSNYPDHTSSECNNIKLAIQNEKSESWKVYSVICLTNYSNGENQVVSKSCAVTTADASDKYQQQQDSTSSTSTLATTITADGNFDL
uniref:Uncharacterized protein n=1 Tax=Tanacetum cinerariifolium TaxID=118510 RepID=A0A6L2JS49_TANCI|nr:hypothetical protein [Tanacetum cinerariifolium]